MSSVISTPLTDPADWAPASSPGPADDQTEELPTTPPPDAAADGTADDTAHEEPLAQASPDADGGPDDEPGRWARLPRRGKVAAVAGVLLTVFSLGAVFGPAGNSRSTEARGTDAPRVRPTAAPSRTPSPSVTVTVSAAPSRDVKEKRKQPVQASSAALPTQREKRRGRPPWAGLPGPPPGAAGPPQARRPQRASVACAMEYRLADAWDGGWYAESSVSNLTDEEVDGWALTLKFPDDRQVVKSQSEFSQSGSAVTLGSRPNNDEIEQDEPVYVGFEGAGGDPRMPPTSVYLNGAPCLVR